MWGQLLPMGAPCGRASKNVGHTQCLQDRAVGRDTQRDVGLDGLVGADTCRRLVLRASRVPDVGFHEAVDLSLVSALSSGSQDGPTTWKSTYRARWQQLERIGKSQASSRRLHHHREEREGGSENPSHIGRRATGDEDLSASEGEANRDADKAVVCWMGSS